MKEVWKPVSYKDNIFKDWYEVSNLGDIRSWKSGSYGHRRIIPKILRPGVGSGGYLVVVLYCKSKPISIRPHVLVAHEFIGTRPDLLHINHIDGDKSNNKIENLEYCTRSENEFHAHRTGLKIGASRKLTEQQVKDIRNDCLLSNNELGLKYGVGESTIYDIKKYKCWKYI